MSIRMNMRIEQALKDIEDIKSRLQVLETAYSAQPKHNDYLPGRGSPNTFVDLSGKIHELDGSPVSVSRETKPRTKKIDKRTKAYKLSRKNVKDQVQGPELT